MLDMHKILFILGLLLVPTFAFAAVTVPWNRISVGLETPLYTVDGILVSASSTITGLTTITSTSTTICFKGDTCRTTWPSGTVYTATYPLTLTGSAFGIAFGTTTSNTWSGLQSFSNATSTLFSATTVWIDTLNLTNALTVANGGTGAQTLTGCLTGNGTGAITGSGTCNTSSLSGSGVAGMMTSWTSANVLQATSTIVGSTVQATSTTVASNFASFINTLSSSGGYKIDNTLILQASSTNSETAVGSGALANNFVTNATRGNVAIGFNAMNLATTSINNVAVGYQALLGKTGGTVSSSGQNTAVGYQAASLTTTGAFNTVYGYQAGKNIGPCSDNTFIGWGAGSGACVSGVSNTAVGELALAAITTGQSNIGIGSAAGTALTTGNNNVAIGTNALLVDTINIQNVAIGRGAFAKLNDVSSANSSSFNFALGTNAFGSAKTGNNNVGIGDSVAFNATSATNTVSIGSGAGGGNDGPAFSNQGSIAIGVLAGGRFTTGSDYNTLIGHQSGYNITSGANNILIGDSKTSANANLTTGSGNIIIGHNISATSSTATNSLNIGNLLFGIGLDGADTTLSTGNIGIGTTTPWKKLSVTGTFAVTALSAFSIGDSAVCQNASGEITVDTGISSCIVSTRTVKHNISPLGISTSTLDILRLNPVGFNYNANNKSDEGLIAEEVASINPTFAQYSKGVPKAINWSAITAELIDVVQTLYSRVGTLVSHPVFGTPARPTGITLYDDISGKPYCVRVHADVLTTTKGECYGYVP